MTRVFTSEEFSLLLAWYIRTNEIKKEIPDDVYSVVWLFFPKILAFPNPKNRKISSKFKPKPKDYLRTLSYKECLKLDHKTLLNHLCCTAFSYNTKLHPINAYSFIVVFKMSFCFFFYILKTSMYIFKQLYIVVSI